MVDRPLPAGLVEPCPPEPVLAVDSPTDNDLFAHADRVAEAGAVCRAKHACLARWVRGEDVGDGTGCQPTTPGAPP
jgi:hypothetical protein